MKMDEKFGSSDLCDIAHPGRKTFFIAPARGNEKMLSLCAQGLLQAGAKALWLPARKAFQLGEAGGRPGVRHS